MNSGGERVGVFISVDLEGVAGLVSWKQEDGPDLERVRTLMTGEANAAIDGALDAGAEEIVVNDAHGFMRNLIPEALRHEARLISGWGKPLSMCQGVDDGSFVAALFVGYHAMAGTPSAVLDHTYSGSTVESVLLSGRPVGEVGLNAGVCGYFGVPVTMVTGDRAVVEEARSLLEATSPKLEAVAVKRGVGRHSACSLHPERARSLIRAASKNAVCKAPAMSPWLPPSPVELTVRFLNPGMADAAELLPFSSRVGHKEVSFRDEDFLRVYKAFRAMVTLARSASGD